VARIIVAAVASVEGEVPELGMLIEQAVALEEALKAVVSICEVIHSIDLSVVLTLEEILKAID
jgi:hypothetical protein